MNFQLFFTLVTLFNLIKAAPIPIPDPLVVIDVTEHTTTTIAVAEVIIGDGYTSTIQLTTIETATGTDDVSTTQDVVSTQTPTITPVTTSTTPTSTTISSTYTPATTYTDENGVVHVQITLAKKIIVDQNGNTVTVSTQELVQNANVDGASTQEEVETSVQITTEALSTTDVNQQSVTTTTTMQIQNAQTTVTPDQSTTSTSSRKNYTTTWANGEVFYSFIDSGLVSSINVAPNVAATTTTVSNTADVASTTGILSLTSSDEKLLLPTLTVGLPKDKNVQMSMINPATVSMTNTAVSTTPVVITTPSSAETTETSTSSSDPGSDLVIHTSISSTSTSTTGASSTGTSSKSTSTTGTSTTGTSTTGTSTTGTSTTGTSTTGTSTTGTSTTGTSTTGTSTTGTSTTGTSTTGTSTTGTSSTGTSSTGTSSSATSSATATYLTKAPKTIVYSPYNDDGTCKDYSTVSQNLQLILSKGITQIRVYGTDCNYMTTVLTLSKLLGITVNQGFWISDAGVDSIDDAVDNLITYISSGAASYSWEIFSFITIGNEAIIANYCTVAELIAKISEVKAKLRAAGYTGDVTTSEPPVTFENNPELCTESEIDFVGINPHSYFDVYSAAADAGTFVAGQIGIVKQYCGDKSIFVTETGYPNAGNQNGKNIPSVENQLIAVQSILDVVGEDVTILTTFEDYWKSPGAYNIEQHFGIIQILPDSN